MTEGSLEPALLAEVRALLPAWIPWARWALVAACGVTIPLVGGGSELLFMRTRLRRDPPAHWTQAARHYYSVLYATSVCAWTAIVILLLLTATVDNPLTHGEPWGLFLLGLVLAEASTISVRRWYYARMFGSWLPRIATWREYVGSFLAFGSPAYVALVMAVGLPSVPRGSGLLVALSGTAWIVFALVGGSPRLSSLGLARELRNPWVQQEVGDRRVRVIAASLTEVTALAYPLQRMVVFSERLLEGLDEREKRGILRHELAHLAEPARVVLLTLPSCILVLVLAWARPLVACVGFVGWGGLVLANLLVMRWTRGRLHGLEERADVQGAREEGSTYARAVEKVYRMQLQPAAMSGKQTHPSLYDRMLAAGVQPDYQRPAPPSVLPVWIFPFLACVASVSIGVAYWRRSDAERDESYALAFSEHLARPLADRAYREFEAGRSTEALTLYRAASSLEPEDPWYAALLSLRLSSLQRCEEARNELERAQRLRQAAPEDENLVELMEEADRELRSCEQGTDEPVR